MLTTRIHVDNIHNRFQVLVALRYFASESLLKVIADTMHERK